MEKEESDTYKTASEATIITSVLADSAMLIHDWEWILSSLLCEWLCADVLVYLDPTWIEDVQLSVLRSLVDKPVLSFDLFLIEFETELTHGSFTIVFTVATGTALVSTRDTHCSRLRCLALQHPPRRVGVLGELTA